jgi:hypothetical protein
MLINDNNNNNNSAEFLFICVLNRQRKGQLQSELLWKIEAHSHTSTKQDNLYHMSNDENNDDDDDKIR